jgi:hypothetical protein
MALLMTAWMWSALDAPERTVPAQNEVSADAPVGERPYEMAWAIRTEERVPLADFEDLQGWSLALYAGADGSLARSREQRLWGEHVAKVTYRGASADSRLILTPPEPIPIAEAFDCVNIWCYGNNWGWVPDATTPQVRLAVHVQDAAGQAFRAPLTHVRWREWWLVHKRVEAATLAEMRFPCRFVGLEIAGADNTEYRDLYFDSLAFYTEELPPLRFEPRPARNLDPFPGQTHGLNGTGEGRLPFPTREETILPENREANFTNEIVMAANGTYDLIYAGPDAHIRYRYNPADGLASGVSVAVNGVPAGRALVGGGVTFAGAAVTPALESVRLDGGTLSATFLGDVAGRPQRVEHHLRIWAKSLVLDVFCRGGAATGLDLGRVEGADSPRLVQVPYLTYGRSNPRVLLSGPADDPLFASVWLDWYRSNGSELYSNEGPEGDGVRLNGGVRYHPKTDGTRNELFERVFLTVSPVFEETLPTIPNPPSPWGKEAGRYLWQESWGPADYDAEHARSRMLHSYGIERLIQCNHEITWRDGGESFTLRTRAAPGKGGDDALRRYVAAQQSLGWRSGLYTNYCDFAPVNEHWDEDAVQRTPENDWRHAWPRCYALKPARAVEWDARLAPIIREQYGSDSAYTDVHTAVAPWAYCDYDARVPGAGTFAATFYAYGELLLNDQKVYNGPIFSEGTYQWLYAGLASGNYALAYTDLDLSEHPLNVAFDLLKIHPLECDVGMPWTGQFFGKQRGWNEPDRLDPSVDRFIAATLAYGHIGWLVEEGHGIRRTCRSYYLIQQAAERYAMVRPRRIEYADDAGKWLTVSQALSTDAIRDSRLHVLYENGLHVYVNWQKDRDWPVRAEGVPWPEVVLPPNGFIVFDAKGFLAASTLVMGARVDQVVSDAYVYMDARDAPASNDWLAASGAVAMHFRRDGDVLVALDIFAIEGGEGIGFRCDIERPRCTAYGADGEELGAVALERRDGKHWLTAVPGARRYAVRRAP